MAMSIADEYGIYAGEIKEKELVKAIDAFLTEYFLQHANYNIYEKTIGYYTADIKAGTIRENSPEIEALTLQSA